MTMRPLSLSRRLVVASSRLVRICSLRSPVHGVETTSGSPKKEMSEEKKIIRIRHCCHAAVCLVVILPSCLGEMKDNRAKGRAKWKQNETDVECYAQLQTSEVEAGRDPSVR